MKKKSLSVIFILTLFFSANAQNKTSQTSTTTTSRQELDGSTNVVTTTTAKRSELTADDLVGSVQLAMSNPNYMVTPGDIYNLSYATGTSSTVSYNIAVDSSYKVRVSNLAVIDAKGKTFPELKSTVESIVSKNYPMSGVQFVLTNPSTFKVVITGEVKKTIEANAWSLSRLSSFIDYVDKTDYASSRFVTITTSDGKITTYDLFQTTRYGDFSQDPYVRPGDIITINRIRRKVTLSGAVEREGTYELKDDENLSSLITYYGNGLSPLADTDKIQITRYISSNSTSGEKLYITKKDIDSDLKLYNLDKIFVNSHNEISPVIFFEGSVMTSDEAGISLNAADKVTIQINENTNYAFLIREKKKYFVNPQSDLQNSYILRDNQILPLDIEKILYDPTFYTDLVALPNDKVVVPFRQFFVTVAGSVVSPGRFPYIPNRSYEYYVGLAGGFNKDRNMGNAVTIVDGNGKKLKKDDFITPECTITAATNSAYYYFYRYASVIAEIATVITAIVTVKAVFPNK